MSKRIKQELKDLATRSYEMELRDLYQDLVADIDLFQRGELSSIDLNERINKFQQGPVREAMNLHMGLTQEMRIARAIALGLMGEGEVPAHLQPGVLPHVDYYRALMAPTNEDTVETP